MREIIIASVLLVILLTGITVNNRFINDFYESALLSVKKNAPGRLRGLL